MRKWKQAIILGVMCFILTIGICVQLKTVNNNGSTVNNDDELKALEEEIKKYNMLLGATEVEGQGATITIADANIISSVNSVIDQSDLLVHDKDLLAVVNELKNAGAEAIEINGQRIVNTSAITCEGNVISVNGQKISSTFTINAIGLSTRLATLKRPGGYLERLEESYIKTTFTRADKITISKYTGITNFKYAKTKE